MTALLLWTPRATMVMTLTTNDTMAHDNDNKARHHRQGRGTTSRTTVNFIPHKVKLSSHQAINALSGTDKQPPRLLSDTRPAHCLQLGTDHDPSTLFYLTIFTPCLPWLSLWLGL